MKILITGADGQLGRALKKVLEQKIPGLTTYAGHGDLDVTDRQAVIRYVAEGEFTHIVNCAAFTDIDRAEQEPQLCKALNADAVGYLAEAARGVDARIIHISTNYVFDGNGNRPYKESDKVNPLQEYGRSKRRGEMLLLDFAPDGLILRTSWLYSEHPGNFLTQMYCEARAGKKAKWAVDRYSTPTYATNLARAILHIITSQRWIGGIFHYSDLGVASCYDVAAEVYSHCCGNASAVAPARTDEYPAAATRPAFSPLDEKLIVSTYGVPLTYWRDSIKECLTNLDKTSVK